MNISKNVSIIFHLNNETRITQGQDKLDFFGNSLFRILDIETSTYLGKQILIII